MKYAIIQLQGKQYKVTEGQILTVDLLKQQEGDQVEITDVLLVNNEGKVEVGQPVVAKAKVTIKVLENGKDEKIRVLKYKSKSKYRKTIGHRQRISNVEVISIA